MANAASTIEIELEIRDAINRLDRLQRELTQSTQSFNKAAQATRKFEGAINKAKAGLVAFFTAISIQKLAQLSDAMTQFENRVKLATNSLAQQLAVQQQLFEVAQKTALPLEDVGQLYSRLRIAAEQLGASQRDLINLTETVGLALKASGTSAASAEGALLQLGQALNSPTVQAEEFNSLLDGMPNLLREVEKELGITAGGLKKFVTDGQLSNKKFFDAILASQQALTEQAKNSATTIEQANQRVANSFTSLIGAIDDKLGASKFFTGFIDGLASGIDKLSNFLGLTTQATGEGGGGGGANLDEVIKEQTGLITDLEASFKGLSIYATTQIMAISEAFEDSSLTIEEYTKKVEDFVKSYTEFYDKVDSGELPGFPSLQFDPETQQQLFLSAEQARKEFELIFKFIAQGFKAFENLNGEAEKYLTYLERITNALSEQLRLLELSEENANRTAGSIVSGVSGAGPNASRAANIAESKSPEEAAAKLILSNEKVAAAIDESFELLFDTIDPLIDLLGDLISAINRLIGALIENATNAAEGLLDTVGLGPNGYIFGGGLARDLEDAFGFGPGSSRDRGPSSMQLAFAEADKVFEAIGQEQSTLEKLQPKIDELAALLDSLSLSEIIERFTEQTQQAIEPLQAEIEKYELALTQTGPMGGANYFAEFYEEQIQIATDKIEEVNEKTSIVISGLISEFLSDPLATLDDLTQSAEDQIAAIEFQNLSAEEQIQFRYDEAIATIEQQRALADLINNEELRNQLLDSVNQATEAQNNLLQKQQEELQKLNEEREREAALMLQQQGQSEIDKIISNLERTFESIFKLVKSLRDQATGLLFGSSSTLTNQQKFQLATTEYQELLAAALDPDATEENVKEFQEFVDTYLQSAQDVFKSSSQYQNIFNSVLADIEEVADFVSIAMPANEIERVKDQLVVIAEEFGVGIEEVINGLDQLRFALAYSALVASVPVQTVIDETNSDLVIEAVVTAVADQELSDTQIEAIVTAAEASGSNTVIEAVVTAVEDKQLSQTEIEAIVTAIAAAGSDTQIDAVVTAIMSNQSDTQIEAVISAIALNTPVISALVDAIAANIPVISARIEIETDDIDNTIDRLGSVLQSSVNTFVTFLNQSTATVEGETLSTLQAFSQGGSSLSSVSYTSYSNKQIAAVNNLSASPKDLAFTYLEKGKPDNPYAIFLRYKDSSNQLWTFTDLNYANSIFDSFTTGSSSSNYSNVQKIGFRQGGLVTDPMDTIPAMLSPGEYILSPETVRRYGVSSLNRLNSGDTAAINATSDPEVKRLLAELIVAVRENDTEVNVYTDMQGQTKASIEEFRSELRERTRRQGDQYVPARYI